MKSNVWLRLVRKKNSLERNWNVFFSFRCGMITNYSGTRLITGE